VRNLGRALTEPPASTPQPWLRYVHTRHAIDNSVATTLVSATLDYGDLKTTSVYAHAQRYFKAK
jgi:hypothetical protein